ncbi:MAG: PA2169 family four-helix-bundle protein [Cytophagaceae bacterium]|nr:PA2169 family four-helix-bundle protein [Cytophagaceae bacterium]
MATENQYEALVEELNDLIEINYDRERGYLKAADDIEDTDLKPLFRSLSEDSAKFASELSEFVRKLHGEPATGQTVSGKLHQVWLDVKAAVTGRDRDAVIGSAQFGDNSAVESYDDLLEEDKVSMMPELMNTLSRQRDAIQRGLSIVSSNKHDDDDNTSMGNSSSTGTAGTTMGYGDTPRGTGTVDPITGGY